MFQNIFLLNVMFGVSNLYFKVLGFHSLTVNNYVLVGSLYQVIHVDDWFGCILSCHGDLRCISYNYNTSSRLCELNYCSGLHLCDRDDLLIYSTGCVFQKIRDCENDRSSSDTSRIQESGKSAPAGFPQNVREINKTSRSIFIAWDAVLTNSSKQQNYKVAYIRFKRITGAAIKTIQVSTVYANLTGLLHNTRYNITVLVYNEHGDGPSSEVVVLKTDQGKPVAPPANVTLFNKTSTSILVTWDEVPYGKRKGQIQQYKVKYKAEKENSKSIEVNRSTHALKIINLKQNTHYNITVSAATVKGFGPSSEPISIFTGQDSPSPPRGFRAVNKTTTSIRLQWHHQQNSAITGYTVNYRPASSAEENQQSTVHGIHDREDITITGLLINVTYSVTIQASDKNGTGPASSPIFVTTSDGSSFQCPENHQTFYKDPESCFRFYECGVNGQVHHKNCAPGTEYSVNSPNIVCDSPSKAFCNVQ